MERMFQLYLYVHYIFENVTLSTTFKVLKRSFFVFHSLEENYS